MLGKALSITKDSIFPIWEDLKKELDKYPNAFGLEFDEEIGYRLSIDYDFVIQVLENQDPSS